MSKDYKFIIRRTLSQERFEILWKKRQNGRATLRDLTEMDEIINRDEGVRQFVLEEMEGEENSNHDANLNIKSESYVSSQLSIWHKLRNFLNNVFHSYISNRLDATSN